MRTLLNILAGICLVPLANLPFTVTASAHAHLTRSEPAAGVVLSEAPATITLWFDQVLDASGSRVILFDANRIQIGLAGIEVDAGDPHIMRASVPDLGPGTYSVVWEATSADDGHTNRDEFAFAVGMDAPAMAAADQPMSGGDAMMDDHDHGDAGDDQGHDAGDDQGHDAGDDQGHDAGDHSH